MIPASIALERLRLGNLRFREGASCRGAATPELLEGQSPFAVILGCSDSRVPTELVFGQGPGDLFTVRVAGNVVAPTQLGSVEFAVQYLGVCLVVVLGHTRCGAVRAVLDGPRREPGGDQRLSAGFPPGLESVLKRVRPVVHSLIPDSPVPHASGSPSDEYVRLWDLAVEANVRASVCQLTEQSEWLAERVQSDDVRIVGATYRLDSGVVEFFDD